MKGDGHHAFALDVDTFHLTRELKRLLKAEPRSPKAHLKYDLRTLTIALGRTLMEVPASGTWPQPVCVQRKWVEVLATTPFEPAITVLRQADGWLHARDFRVKCSVDAWTEDSEALAKRKEDLDGAHRILARYRVTKREVGTLIKDADPTKSQLWEPNDGSLIDKIARVWKQLAVYGVEPSDIRRLIHRKSRALYKSGRKPYADGYGPLEVTEREQRALIEDGDTAKAELWRSNDGRLLDDIALAWKQLAVYGVEPSDIRRLVDRKARLSKPV
jgi:hypothetical protein